MKIITVDAFYSVDLKRKELRNRYEPKVLVKQRRNVGELKSIYKRFSLIIEKKILLGDSFLCL